MPAQRPSERIQEITGQEIERRAKFAPHGTVKTPDRLDMLVRYLDETWEADERTRLRICQPCASEGSLVCLNEAEHNPSVKVYAGDVEAIEAFEKGHSINVDGSCNKGCC